MQSSLSYWSPSSPAPSPPLHPSLYRRRWPQSRHRPPPSLPLLILLQNSTNPRTLERRSKIGILLIFAMTRWRTSKGLAWSGSWWSDSPSEWQTGRHFSAVPTPAPNAPLGTKFILLSIWFRIMSCRYFWQFTSRKLCTQFFQLPSLRVHSTPLTDRQDFVLVIVYRVLVLLNPQEDLISYIKCPQECLLMEKQKKSDLLREGQLPWTMKMMIPLSIYWQMQRASSKDICRLTEGDCLDSTALPTFTPDSKMGTLSWGKVLQPTFPNFKLLYAKNALAVQTTIFLYGKTASLSLKNRNIWDLATFWWIAWSGSWFWPRQGECNQACHIRHHQALLRHCPPSISAVLGTERTPRPAHTDI